MTQDDDPRQAPVFDCDMVRHIAYLVRLGITEEQAEAFGAQFQSIIDYFNLLNEADIEGVPPAIQARHANNVMREDEAIPSMPRESFLENVPQCEGYFVKVPTVLEIE
jgi:aspartyl-tRNA(Asn)/glutamyl-tRNA(Gln) amidotransferase subunit C